MTIRALAALALLAAACLPASAEYDDSATINAAFTQGRAFAEKPQTANEKWTCAAFWYVWSDLAVNEEFGEAMVAKFDPAMTEAAAREASAHWERQAVLEMGLGMGGSMKQEIYDDRFKPHQWETGVTSRCYVHLLNSVAYAQVTGHLPPHRPYEAADYAAAGLPWFDYYSDQKALGGAKKFKGLKTWKDFHGGSSAKAVNVEPKNIVHLAGVSGSGRPVSQGDGF